MPEQQAARRFKKAIFLLLTLFLDIYEQMD